jgi:hypothetical protein
MILPGGRERDKQTVGAPTEGRPERASAVAIEPASLYKSGEPSTSASTTTSSRCSRSAVLLRPVLRGKLTRSLWPDGHLSYLTVTASLDGHLTNLTIRIGSAPRLTRGNGVEAPKPWDLPALLAQVFPTLVEVKP